MRKAIHQISAPHKTSEDASDALAGISNPGSVEWLGITAAWVCGENRLHFIAANIAGLDTLEAADLKPGQRLVWTPDAA